MSSDNDNDIILSVKNVSKCFEMCEKPVHRIFPTPSAEQNGVYKEFWALKDIDFAVRKGECIGIIGRNGADKLALLQIIAGTLAPTTGEVKLKGRVAALFELGGGYNPEFTGKENVYLKGAILGLSKAEIAAKYDEIVKLAGIGEFIDQPVKTYTSGMIVRLAFAVNTLADPDVLIVDEALVVGDVEFQRKFATHMRKLVESGVTILFASHNVFAVRTYCNRAIWLANGEVRQIGDVKEVTSQYLEDLLDGNSMTDVGSGVRAEILAARAELQTAYQYLNDILWEVREVRRHQNRGWIKNFILGFPGMPLVVRKLKNVHRRVRRDGIGKALSYYRVKYRFANLITGGNVCVKDLVAREMKRGKYRGVYVIPTIPWDVPIFQRPQQMALAMRKKGYLVVYLEYPIEIPAGTLREVMPGLFVATVADFAVALRDVEGCVISINSTASALCYPDSRIVTKEFVSRNRVVYEYIDHFDEKISWSETAKLVGFYKQLTSSDWPVHYLASARNLQAELAERTGRKVMYVANGVDSRHFSAENITRIARQIKLPDCFLSKRVKVGYFGALAPWLDYALIGDVVREHPEWDFIFIGPDYLGASKQLPSASNCHWVGPIDYKVLPYYASKFDVAILPFQSGDLAKSTSPLKLFEYFALGKPVVVTQDMAECTAFPEVFRGAGSAGLAAGISDALKAKDDPKFQERMHQLAEENTWDARATVLLKGLEE